MMPINYTTDAFLALTNLVNFIESKNTAGAGLRWLNRYEIFLKKQLLNPSQIKLCHNLTLHLLQLRCIYYNEWLIAFSVHTDHVLKEALLHKSRISD